MSHKYKRIRRASEIKNFIQATDQFFIIGLLVKQRMSQPHRLELIQIFTQDFHQFIVFITMDHIGRLYDQLFTPGHSQSFQSLRNCINAYSVPLLQFFYDPAAAVCPPHLIARQCRRNRLFHRINILCFRLPVRSSKTYNQYNFFHWSYALIFPFLMQKNTANPY